MKTNDLSSAVRAIAFYLPQFHPIPENDRWWGKGFTEWTNVTRARPLFEGHYQPRRPADLGYYDLRLEDVRVAQAELAKQYGIHGFCYYFYWFESGKKLLNRPIEAMLASGKPDFPFCVCWANEDWTRRWDGRNATVLVRQDVSIDTCTSLIRELAPYFQDERYIRVDGRPLFLLYRSDVFADFPAAIRALREEARKIIGIDLYIVCSEHYDSASRIADAGCDAIYEFPNGYSHLRPDRVATHRKSFFAPFKGMISNYADLADFYLNFNPAEHKQFKGVTLGWDNTARKNDAAVILDGFSLDAYYQWLAGSVRITTERMRGDENLVFINAWNEWAEGTYLEPDERYGHRYLQVTEAALKGRPAAPEILKDPALKEAASFAVRDPSPSYSENIPENKEAQFPYIANLWKEDAGADAFNQTRYYSKPRTELFDAIGNPGSAMLDVGCGAGATSAELKKRHPVSRFFGVELQAEVAAEASRQLDRVICGNFENLIFSEAFPDGQTFDTVLFADVLEHMYNPWQTLRRTAELLSPGGKVVASIPNIFNLQLIDNLCRGVWNYQHYGLMDFTHIRFFTLRTITEMFRETGYKVASIRGLPLPTQWMPPMSRDSLGHISTAAMSFKKMDDLMLQQLRCLQYVIVARR